MNCVRFRAQLVLRTYSERVILDGKSVMSNPRGIHNPKSVALTLSYIDAGPRYLRTANIASNTVDHCRIRYGFDIILIVRGEKGCGGLNIYLGHINM